MMHRLSAFVGVRTVTALLVALASSACGPADEEVELLEQDQAHEIGSGGSDTPLVASFTPKYSEKFLVMDDAENTITLGIDPVPDASRGHAVYANRYSPTTGWEPARRITTIYSDPAPMNGGTPVQNALLTQPISLLGDRAGNAAVVYYLSGTGSYGMTRYTPGRGWGAAVTVPTAHSQSIRFDGAGNVVLIGKETSEGVTKFSWRRHSVATGWEAPQLSGAVEDGFTVRSIATDDAGNAMLVEMKTVTVNNAPTYTLQDRRYVVGSGWAAPETFPTSVTGAQTWGGSAGNFMTIWHDGDAINASLYVSGKGWTAPSQIGSSSSLWNVQNRADSAGNFMTAWEDGEGIKASRYVSGKGWTAPSQIGPNGYLMTMAMDRAGNTLVAWNQRVDPVTGYPVTVVKARRYKAGVGWGGVTRLSSYVSDCFGSACWVRGDAGRPLIAADTQGNMNVVWDNTDHEASGTNYFNIRARRLFASGAWGDQFSASGPRGSQPLTFGATAGGSGSVHVLVRPQDEGTDPTTLHRFVTGVGWTHSEPIRWSLNPAATAALRIEPVTPSAMTVFTTSQGFTSVLGGMAGANAKCRAAADSARLVGSFKAWISTAQVSAAQNIAHAHSLPYVRTDGQKVADNWADLTDGTLDAAINVSETGGRGGDGIIWTGTQADGTYAGASCSNWTKGGYEVLGVTGRASDGYWTLAGRWTNFAYSTEQPENCGVARSLYCIQEWTAPAQ